MINYERIKDGLKAFLESCKQESSETKEAGLIIAKYAKYGKITEEEEGKLKQQLQDVAKIAGIGIPFAVIPGASLLLPLLIKVAQEHEIDLLPSAFASTGTSSEKAIMLETIIAEVAQDDTENPEVKDALDTLTAAKDLAELENSIETAPKATRKRKS